MALLIDASRPPGPGMLGTDNTFHQPALGLVALATTLMHSTNGRQVDVKILDSSIKFTSEEDAHTHVCDFAPGVLGIRCLHVYTTLFQALTESAKLLASPPTVDGGPYPNAGPRQALEGDPNPDLVRVGEGGEAFRDIVDDVFNYPPERAIELFAPYKTYCSRLPSLAHLFDTTTIDGQWQPSVARS